MRLPHFWLLSQVLNFSHYRLYTNKYGNSVVLCAKMRAFYGIENTVYQGNNSIMKEELNKLI